MSETSAASNVPMALHEEALADGGSETADQVTEPSLSAVQEAFHRRNKSFKAFFKRTASSNASSTASSNTSSPSSTDESSLQAFYPPTMGLPPTVAREAGAPSSDQLYDRLASLRSRVSNGPGEFSMDNLGPRASMVRSRGKSSPTKLQSRSSLVSTTPDVELERPRNSIATELSQAVPGAPVALTIVDNEPEGETYDAKWTRGPLGIMLTYSEELHRPYVSKLTENGHPEDLGVQLGDILIAINRVSTTFFNFEATARTLATIPLPAVLTFTRPPGRTAGGKPLRAMPAIDSETEDVNRSELEPVKPSGTTDQTQRPTYYAVLWQDKAEKLGLVFTPGPQGAPMVKKVSDSCQSHIGRDLVRPGDILVTINNHEARTLNFEVCMEMIKSASIDNAVTSFIFHSVSPLSL